MKNKKFLILTLLLIASLLLPSCKNTTDVHECNFGFEWKKDESKHWLECECGLKSSVGNHNYVIKLSDNATYNLSSTEDSALTATFTSDLVDLVMYGDANGDGQIDTEDVEAIRVYISKFNYETNSSSVNLEVGADANK